MAKRALDRIAHRPAPKEWDPTTFHAPPTRSAPEKSDITPPPVPGGTGRGSRTSVDTPSMELFADNMDKLAEPVKKAYDKLMQLQKVNPGAFYDAYMLRQVACGANGDSGLQNNYLKVLHSLGQGLADISAGMRQLSANYKTTEEEATMTAEDLNTAMQSAQSDFSKMNSGG
ncbi:hypothetical protein AQJ67_05030 [Streptomyces caeruleatus]|uniref:Uncharacterized protein n=2 Tax=Streptomyces caeruleatus TaxID=661399 RepID=A0A101U7B4_9ACTN|nr:hypothetical protein AQJ67_05030 [Streptomyces caeruleatus]